MGSNSQSKSYFPGYTRDLNMVANSSTWQPLNNNDQVLQGSPLNNTFSSSPANRYASHNSKDIIKQTMLKHEAVFKDQIQELHRLYIKQKELMKITIRNELHTDDSGLETSQAAPVMSQIFSHQRECRVPSLDWPKPACQYNFVPVFEDMHSTLSSGKAKCTQMGLDHAQTESTLTDSDLLVSKCKKYGKKALDLSLPAEEYIDSDEGESNEEGKISNAPQIPSNGDVKPNLDSCGLNSVSEGDVLPPNSHSRKRKFIIDLNEPVVNLEEAAAPGSIELGGLENTPGKTKSCNEVISKEVVHQDTKAKLDLSNSCHSRLVGNSSMNPARKLVPCSYVVNTSASSSHSSQRRPIVQALPCFASPLNLGSSRGRPKTAIKKVQHSEIVRSSPKLDGRDESLSKSPKVCEPSGNFDKLNCSSELQETKCQNLMHSNSITASCSPNMSVSFMDKEVLDPTGGLPSLKPKTPYFQKPYEGREDSTGVECILLALSEFTHNLDSNKVEATFCSSKKRVSGFSINDEPRNSNNRCSSHGNLDTSSANSSKDKYIENIRKDGADSLHWLAEVVSSVTSDLENECVVLSGTESAIDEKLMSKEIDYFEAMTLKLPEVKVEERWSMSKCQKQEEAVATPFPCQPKKVRTRRTRQWKDCNNKTGKTRQRTALEKYAGKSGWTEGGRKSRPSASSSTESTMHTELERKRLNSILGFEELRFIGWGKVTKRPRGRRIPISNIS